MSEKISALTEKFTIADEDMFVIVDSGAGDNKKVSGQTIKSQTGGIINMAVRIPSADVLTSNSIPVTLIASPGAGKAIAVISGEYKIDFNSVSYGGGFQEAVIQTNGANVPQTSKVELASTVTVMQKLSIQNGIYANDISVFDNQPLLFMGFGGDPTGGDSDVIIYLTYKLIDTTI